MSELPWGPQIVDEAHPDQQTEHAEPGTLAMSADDFSSLEERILRAVNLVKREKLARTAAEERATEMEARAAQAEERALEAGERATQAEARLAESATAAEQLQKDVTALRAERDHVRQRVEKLLGQLDALEL
ncbi:MAG TPA: hypothetical protein VGG85_18000 [Terracidiphilus sp.]|jgi:chromosome segregation ATPase